MDNSDDKCSMPASHLRRSCRGREGGKSTMGPTGSGTFPSSRAKIKRGFPIDPGRWELLAKRLVWRCCGCGMVHRVRFRVVRGEIWVRGW